MSSPNSTEIEAPPHLLELLAKLHQRSLDEEALIKAPGGGYDKIRGSLQDDPAALKRYQDDLMRDKFIALDADKACFMYNLVRCTRALNVVECGTSYGVSTIYLALAVGQNAEAANKSTGEAKVIATEYEPSKAKVAKEHWHQAGESVEPWIEFREGDLLQTLKSDMPLIDFVLFDIWTDMVVPTLDILEPRLKHGAVLLVDNTVASRGGYEAFLARIKAENSNYKSMTLPFDGGLEMVTYWPR
ncbi:S-adenosyl-L-methionine-dependent methyltransferase [Acrodontium crateriforme]|uniref:S-adenosyl-L-methionine-dependent methyltransferase n=1 Tax=Acrodontium crateriforme TaxID=150365 RepID=A0AAQ3R5M9_9PEZI|nr:S-adenosyl-L-methionine-dependent methyltransferase [Acrodontium crateriforme]